MKNVITGAVTETSFNPTAKFENAYVEKKDMEYSYNDGDLYYFMDQETYDMIPIAKELLGDSFRFVKENMVCKVNSYKGKVFAVDPPPSWSWKSPRPTPALRATLPPTSPSPPPWRPGQRSRSPSSSTPATR